jgi:hypothetical protein
MVDRPRQFVAIASTHPTGRTEKVRPHCAHRQLKPFGDADDRTVAGAALGQGDRAVADSRSDVGRAGRGVAGGDQRPARRQQRFDASAAWGLLVIVGLFGYVMSVTLSWLERRIAVGGLGVGVASQLGRPARAWRA